MGGHLTAQFWWKEKIARDFGHAYKVELVYEEKGLQLIQIFQISKQLATKRMMSTI